ncbi:MAG: hypothetical protein HKN32_08415 [Flavobacteriales bacterium]|nr:hypothetical protein [Flavobacteriales bacterium]
MNVDAVRSHLQAQEEVLKIDDLHIWTLDGEYNIMTVDVCVDPALTVRELEQFKAQTRHQLKEMNVQHITFEFRPLDHSRPCP